MNILLIEPDAALATVYARVLRAAGHRVMTAFTAQGAIHAADEQCPDVVLLEMQLVSHSGIEFLYEFRSYADWQTIPVIVLSLVPPGEFSGSWRLLHNELGVTAYHYKPQMSLSKLCRAVDGVVHSSSPAD